MRPRTQAREAALKALYQLDLRADAAEPEVEEILRDLPTEESRRFARQLVWGTREQVEGLDEQLNATAHNWEIRRMAAIDRNVLRLGAYELLHLGATIPAAVAINEAVSLAKRYSTKDSGSFVNGILDKIYHRRPPLDEEPVPPAELPATPVDDEPEASPAGPASEIGSLTDETSQEPSAS